MNRIAVKIGERAQRRVAFVAAFGLLMLGVAAPAAAEPFREDAFATYKGDPKNGEYMAATAGCAACHASGDNVKLLSGGQKMDTFIGTLFAPNITPDPAGIGGWSNAQFLNATMRGIGKDGRHLYPVMPYAAYAGMNPTDMLDIKAYLETLQKSDARTEANRISWPYNMSLTMSMWKRANLNETPFQPGDGSQMSRGRYLVENVGACGECHTPRTGLYGLDQSRAFQGEKGLGGGAALDISKGRIAAVGDSTFIKRLFEDGTKLGGGPFGDPIMRRMAQGLQSLNDADRRAVVAYLKGAEVQAPKVADTAEAACKDPTAQAATAGSDPGLARAADEFMTTHCRSCHGPGESAQGSYPSGDLASIAADAAFLIRGDAANSPVFKSIKSGRMPKGTQPSAAEIDTFGKWIDSLKQPAPVAASALAGQPRKRQVVDWRSYTLAAAGDIGKVNEADRPFIRYFSFRPQFNGVLPCEDQKKFMERMRLYDAGFNKLLNSLSLEQALVVPAKVEGAPAPLARVDIRDLGWDVAKWDALVATYPYALDPAGDGTLQGLAAQTRTQVPILRVDWFMANAAKPANYHNLLGLTPNIADLEKGRLNVNVDDNIRRRRVVRAAFLQGSSGVSDHNRMIERHALPRGGYYWKSYDFAESRNLQDLTKRPHGPPEIEPLDQGLQSFHHDGGEMIFQLPNGLQGYYLSTAKGDRLDEGPTSIVSFRDRPVGRVGGVIVSNGKTCFACHVDGIIAKRDQLRSKIEATFPAGQREILLDMYVPQKELEAVYDADRKAFVAALDKINATQSAPDGSKTSATGPGKEEIVNWFADLYEDNLDLEALASEFDMTGEEFQNAGTLVGDPVQSQLVNLWLTQLKGGAKVPRFEVEQQFFALSKPLLRVQSIAAKPPAPPAAAGGGATAAAPPAPAIPDYKSPAMQVSGDASGKLTLELKVASSNVLVGQDLNFDVTANRACELQVFYVEDTGNVEVISQSLIGAPFLEPGKPRRIPDPRGGSLVFDTPGKDESLVLFCREGGLGDQRLTAEAAKALVLASRTAPTRGLAQRLTEQNVANTAPLTITNLSSPAKVTSTPGSSAVHIVTFNVRTH